MTEHTKNLARTAIRDRLLAAQDNLHRARYAMKWIGCPDSQYGDGGKSLRQIAAEYEAEVDDLARALAEIASEPAQLVTSSAVPATPSGPSDDRS